MEDEQLKLAIKQVNIKYNEGIRSVDSVQTMTSHFFLASENELGGYIDSESYRDQILLLEGSTFEYFKNPNTNSDRLKEFSYNCTGQYNRDVTWFTRSATPGVNTFIYAINYNGEHFSQTVSSNGFVVPCFVI